MTKAETKDQDKAATSATDLLSDKLGSEKQKQELLHSRLISAKFGNIVSVLMQSTPHKNMRLSSLRDYVVPALLNSQYRLAEVSKEGSGNIIPVSLILWAKVSDEVDARLRASLDKPFVLEGEEWTGGNNYWMIDAIGPERFLTPLLTDLRKTDFKGKVVNYRVRTEAGPVVKTLADGEPRKAA